MSNYLGNFVKVLKRLRGKNANTEIPDRSYGRVLPPAPLLLIFSMEEQIHFAKRLSMILRSGMSLMQGLNMSASQASTKSGRFILQSLALNVEHGSSLSFSMQKFENIFGPFCINVVRVGEASGTLHENLEYLAEELKKKNILRKKVQGSMIYPLIIVILTIVISLVLTVFIFPKITPIFQSFNNSLPLPTRVLMGFSHFLMYEWLRLLVVLIALSVFWYFLSRLHSVRLIRDRVVLRIPLFGKLALYYNLANIFRTLSLLLRSDVHLLTSFRIAAESTQNHAYQEVLKKAVIQIEKGQRIANEFEKYPEFFPILSIQMLSVGEQTGNFNQTLMYLSDVYEEEISDVTKSLTALVEPVLMIVMGAVVGFIAISIIMPIYGITQTIGSYR